MNSEWVGQMCKRAVTPAATYVQGLGCCVTQGTDGAGSAAHREAWTRQRASARSAGTAGRPRPSAEPENSSAPTATGIAPSDPTEPSTARAATMPQALGALAVEASSPTADLAVDSVADSTAEAAVGTVAVAVEHNVLVAV